jgi:monoamine oxidase
MRLNDTVDTIVLGAGIAGLIAARSLAEAGRRVTILEAQQQVGGRMRTRHVPDLAQPVELGAEFIHGRPPELLSLLDEAGLAIVETAGRQVCHGADGLTDCPENDGSWELLEAMAASAARDGDMSFNAYLARTDAPETAKRRARGYVEGFNAADANTIGIGGLARQQAAEDAIEGDRAARVIAGYQSLAAYVSDRAIAAGASLQLDTPARRVGWQPGHVAVTSESGEQWTARSLVCTLPLGVLQARCVLFTPEPRSILHAAASLSAGTVQRMVFEFTEPWWATAQPEMRFLFAPELFPPTWWTTAPQASPFLTGWVGGPRALERADQPSLTQQALHTLEQVFSMPIAPKLVALHHHDWQRDPWCRGAYSSVTAGAADAPAALATPVETTLFFAGEHTDTTGHPGTVHGALRSGLRAARQVLDLT